MTWKYTHFQVSFPLPWRRGPVVAVRTYPLKMTLAWPVQQYFCLMMLTPSKEQFLGLNIDISWNISFSQSLIVSKKDHEPCICELVPRSFPLMYNNQIVNLFLYFCEYWFYQKGSWNLFLFHYYAQRSQIYLTIENTFLSDYYEILCFNEVRFFLIGPWSFQWPKFWSSR